MLLIVIEIGTPRGGDTDYRPVRRELNEVHSPSGSREMVPPQSTLMLHPVACWAV